MKMKLGYILGLLALPLTLNSFEATAQTDTAAEAVVPARVADTLRMEVDSVQPVVDTVAVPISDTLSSARPDSLRPAAVAKLSIPDSVLAVLPDSNKVMLPDSVLTAVPDSSLTVGPDTSRTVVPDSMPVLPDTVRAALPDTLEKTLAAPVRDTVQVEEKDTAEVVAPITMKEVEVVQVQPVEDTVELVLPDLDSLAAVADALRDSYHFEESCNLYYDIIRQAPDSLARVQFTDRKIISQNGLAMMGFVASPKVVAKKQFSLADFYLWYPLPDKSWRAYPNVLDSLGKTFPVTAVYVPEEAESIYYSAHDDSGARNIYYTEAGDSLWTVPALLNEAMTSSANEIFPMLSADGGTLYFASDGLFGAGGYDLYSSTWNEEENDWGEPQNLGFPFSSPANDYLYVNSPDGKYSLFASDRGCSSDSVWVYVIEYDSLPIRKEVKDPEQLSEICELVPQVQDQASKGGLSTEIPENLDIRRYMDKIAQVNALKDTIFAYTVRRDQQKNEFAVSDDVEKREELTRTIDENEKAIVVLQDSLDVTRKKLQEIEMEFLFSGVVIDPQKLMEEAEKEVVPENPVFDFVRHEMGDVLEMELAVPEVSFDYTFRIQDSTEFAVANALPEGLVYQIYLVARKTKAGAEVFKGITPVFEMPSATVTYEYRAGLFPTYADALSKLNIVKRKGFRNAKIYAFKDGEKISVQSARALEKKMAAEPDFYEVVFAGEQVNADLIEEVMVLSGKEVAKGERNGKIVYIVGPFDLKSDADAVTVHLLNSGVEQVTANIIEK